MARGLPYSKWSTQDWTPAPKAPGAPKLSTGGQTTLLSEVEVRKDRRPRKTARVRRSTVPTTP